STFISLNTLVGYRSASRRLHRPGVYADAGCGAGYRRLSGGRGVAPSGDCDTGNPALALSRGSHSASLHTPEHDRCFPGMLLFPDTVSGRGKPSDPGTSLRVPPGWAGDMTERLVAQTPVGRWRGARHGGSFSNTPRTEASRAPSEDQARPHTTQLSTP